MFIASKIKKQDRWLFRAELAEQLLATGNPLELIRISSRKLADHVEADILLHYLVEKSGNILLLNTFEGIPEEIAKRIEQISYESPFCDTLSIFDQTHPPGKESPWGWVLADLMQAQGIKCVVWYPLAAHGRAFGSLVFGSHAFTQFPKDDLEQMRAITAQVSTAISRMQNEQKLREAEERWRILSEATFEGILINENGIISDLNQQMADLVGWSMEEIKGQQILKFIAPEDWEKVQETISSDQDIRAEYRVIHKDGTIRIFEARSRPSLACGGLKGMTVVRDITERKQIEADLLKRGKQLEELTTRLEQRVKDRTSQIEHLVAQLRALSVKLIQVEQNERRHLAAILHDDIQQLLVASKMRVELCLQNPRHERNVDLCHEANQILCEALEHCRSLVVELYPLVLQRSGLAAGLHWLAEHYEQKHHFKVVVNDGLQNELLSQELRSLLFESARELLLNAVKHAQSPDAQVTLARTPHQEISLSVDDRGRGFDHGKQLDQTTSGFGLFSIQQRLKHIGGRMEIASTPGQGSRITLIVPQDVAGEPGFSHSPLPVT